MLKSGPENIPEYICQQKKFTDLTFDLNTSYTSGQFGPQLRYYLYGDYYKNETYVKRWGQGEFFLPMAQCNMEEIQHQGVEVI